MARKRGFKNRFFSKFVPYKFAGHRAVTNGYDAVGYRHNLRQFRRDYDNGQRTACHIINEFINFIFRIDIYPSCWFIKQQYLRVGK